MIIYPKVLLKTSGYGIERYQSLKMAEELDEFKELLLRLKPKSPRFTQQFFTFLKQFISFDG